jgi:hypothetical protein
LSTVSSSTTKGKTPAKVGGAGVEPVSSGSVSTRPKRRRPPLIVWALTGALVAATYGRFFLSMHFGPPLVMLSLGGLTLILGAAALWRMIDPLTRGERPIAPEARAPHRTRELEREKQAVLKAIKEIELDYQMRKISELDYREMVERYRARALRVMGDLAAGNDYRALIERELKDRLAVRAAMGGSAAGAGSAVGADSAVGTDSRASGDVDPLPLVSNLCACGAPNDSDARYCKRCGQKLTSSTSQV